MSIYTEEYKDSIEFDTKITTKKRDCILAVFTNAVGQGDCPSVTLMPRIGKWNSFHALNMSYCKGIDCVKVLGTKAKRTNSSLCGVKWF